MTAVFVRPKVLGALATAVLISQSCRTQEPGDPAPQQPSTSVGEDEEGPVEPGTSQSSPKQEPKKPKLPEPSPLPDNSQDPDTIPECDCAENSDLIYTLSDAHALWAFDPTKLSFVEVGSFNCNTMPFDTPFSLGVDRHSRAWVQMTPSGSVHVVDTLNGNTCKDSGYKPGAVGFQHFGMAFMDDPKDAVCEQLYMHSFDGLIWSEGEGVGKMGTLDPEGLTSRAIGPINYNGGELTGTQDGRLFAFAGEPAKLVEYRAKDATVIRETKLEGLSLTMAFAFAFWGGDFYFFTQADAVELPMRSKVTKLDYTGDGSLQTIVEKAPIHIVGAGVSVCAPLEPPPPA